MLLLSVLLVAIVLPERLWADFPKFDTVQVHGNYSQVMNFSLNAQKEFIILFNQSNSLNPYRINAWVNDIIPTSCFKIVVHQEKYVSSWNVPDEIHTSKIDQAMSFYNTSRTLCHHQMLSIIENRTLLNVSQDFILILSASSIVNQNISLLMQEEVDFYIKINKTYNFLASPSQTKYFYFHFVDNNVEAVLIKIKNDKKLCIEVSIQNTTCPIFIMERDMEPNIKYATITEQGGFILSKTLYPNGFYLVFVVKTDDYICTNSLSNEFPLLATNRSSNVEFIVESISDIKYTESIAATLIIFLIFAITAVLIQIGFNNFGTITKINYFVVKENDAKEECLRLKVFETEQQEDPISQTNTEKQEYLTLDVLEKYSANTHDHAYDYLWYIINIAIFYCVPVVQLVYRYLEVVNQTGDQDKCYYNFYCAHPAWGLNDFNHFFSNVGYVITGILFMICVSLREQKVPSNQQGIFVHYGTFYTMGIALILEGVLSACYHICPSKSNFQFDTSFMYIMLVLYLVRLYQNRHPKISTKSYKIYTALGLTIFVTVMGILYAQINLWILFILGYVLLTLYISANIYVINFGFIEIKNIFHKNHTITWPKTKKIRLNVLIFVNLINYLALIVGCILSIKELLDFASFLLYLMLMNVLLYTTFYTVMKTINGEKICCEALLYLLLAICFWLPAVYFFVDNASKWMDTPAESRRLNQECVLNGFYDNHDIWHLLSAPALYFSFMFLLYLDDDLLNTERINIKVF